MKNKISVIVPVYCIEKYLPNLLDSLKNQTFCEYEVLLIDDGSTDNSGKICDNFCSHNSNFKVYHIENGGVSNARNYGLSKACGDYIAFVDGDDYLDNDYLKKLYQGISKGYDIAFCRFAMAYKDKTIYYFEEKLPLLCDNTKKIDLFLIDTYFIEEKNKIATDCVFGSCCRSLFKREIISKNHIKFCSGLVLGEDTVFMMDYLLNCKSAIFIDESLYFYRVREKSATELYSKGYTKSFLSFRFPTFLEIRKRINHNPYFDAGYKKVLFHYFCYKFLFQFVVNEMKLSPNYTKKALNEIRDKKYKELFSFRIKEFKPIIKLTFKRKLLCFFLKHKMFLFIRFYFSCLS